jgi:hypothetical protein
MKNRDISITTVMATGLDDRKIGSLDEVGAKYFSVPHSFHTACEAHSPHLVLKLRVYGHLYIHSPIRFRGMVLN